MKNDKLNSFIRLSLSSITIATRTFTHRFQRYVPGIVTALLLSVTTAAWGQLPRMRGTLYTDGCYYILKANPVIPPGQPGYLVLERQGCRLLLADGRIYYHDDRTQIWQDEVTGRQYAANGTNTSGYIQDSNAGANMEKARRITMGLCTGESISEFNSCLDKRAAVKRDDEKYYHTQAEDKRVANKYRDSQEDFRRSLDKSDQSRKEFEKSLDKPKR